MEKKRRKKLSKKGRWKSFKMRGPFISIYLFIFSPFTFQNYYNLLWIYQNGNFLLGKSISCREKSGKMTLPPQKNVPVYAPAFARYNWPHSFSCAARCCKCQISCHNKRYIQSRPSTGEVQTRHEY